MSNNVIGIDGQTVLLISNDTAFCGAARRDFHSRRTDVRVSCVGEVGAALVIMCQIAPSAILLAEEVVAPDGPDGERHLETVVIALGIHAPVVVLGKHGKGTAARGIACAGICRIYVARRQVPEHRHGFAGTASGAGQRQQRKRTGLCEPASAERFWGSIAT